MISSWNLVRREGIILIGFVVLGFVILSFLFDESTGGYYQGLFTERGMDLMVTWTAFLGPYAAYLLIRSMVWLIKVVVLFIRTVGYVVDVSHQPKALAEEERLSGRFAMGTKVLVEGADT